MGKKGIFLVPHQAWGYPNLLLCMDGGVSAPILGAALENLPVSGGSQAPPEPHRCVQPCLSLVPGGIQCLSQPRRHPPKRLFLHVLMGLGVVMELLPQSPAVGWGAGGAV